VSEEKSDVQRAKLGMARVKKGMETLSREGEKSGSILVEEEDFGIETQSLLKGRESSTAATTASP
jgi:hypothetical protein